MLVDKFFIRRTFAAAAVLGLMAVTAPMASASDIADLNELKTAAEAGDARALDTLGNAYWRGRGVPQDIGLAESYLRRAISAGRDRSRINLARLLAETGRGDAALVIFDEARALNLDGVEYWIAVEEVRGNLGARGTPEDGLAELDRLAASGDARAAYAMADALDGGAAVVPDPARAAAIYQGLSDQGHARAAARLGEHYWQGFGVPKDLERAEMLLETAIANGEPRAAIELTRVLVEAGKSDKAFDTINRAVADGLEGANFWLARFNARGDFGALSDADKGRAELERLSAGGDLDATVELARLAGRSRRSPVDPVMIAERLEIPSAAGEERATLALLRLLRERGRSFPDGVARRQQILSDRAAQLPDDRRVPEEIWLITAKETGRARYRAVSAQLDDASGLTLQRGLRAALSADRRAYTWVLQEQLAEQGFYAGSADGWMTARTISAFRQFCRRHGVDDVCTHGPLRSDAVTAITPFL